MSHRGVKHSTTVPLRWYRGAKIPRAVIRRFARQVAERFRPDKVILFGSYAYGTPHADSDVDILVIGRSSPQVAVTATSPCLSRVQEPPGTPVGLPQPAGRPPTGTHGQQTDRRALRSWSSCRCLAGS